jgi:hypothetical protein
MTGGHHHQGGQQYHASPWNSAAVAAQAAMAAPASPYPQGFSSPFPQRQAHVSPYPQAAHQQAPTPPPAARQPPWAPQAGGPSLPPNWQAPPPASSQAAWQAQQAQAQAQAQQHRSPLRGGQSPTRQVHFAPSPAQTMPQPMAPTTRDNMAGMTPTARLMALQSSMGGTTPHGGWAKSAVLPGASPHLTSRVAGMQARSGNGAAECFRW